MSDCPIAPQNNVVTRLGGIGLSQYVWSYFWYNIHPWAKAEEEDHIEREPGAAVEHGSEGMEDYYREWIMGNLG